MTIKRRIERLEREGPVQGEVVFISTGVPRHDKMGRLDMAITPQGWLTKRPLEADKAFEARVKGGCTRLANLQRFQETDCAGAVAHSSFRTSSR